MSLASKFPNVEENLGILSEECAEVIKIERKIARFGIDDFYPGRGVTNREELQEECGHVMAMIQILIDNGVITRQGLVIAMANKFAKLPLWYGGLRNGR